MFHRFLGKVALNIPNSSPKSYRIKKNNYFIIFLTKKLNDIFYIECNRKNNKMSIVEYAKTYFFCFF